MYNHLYNKRNIFSVIDSVGIDVSLNILKNLKTENEFIYIPKILEDAVSKNILGKKNKTSILQLIN